MLQQVCERHAHIKFELWHTTINQGALYAMFHEPHPSLSLYNHSLYRYPVLASSRSFEGSRGRGRCLVVTYYSTGGRPGQSLVSGVKFNCLIFCFIRNYIFQKLCNLYLFNYILMHTPRRRKHRLMKYPIGISIST